MSNFANAIENTEQVSTTENGMPTLSSSMNRNVDLFFAIGSSRGKDITDMYELAYQENKETAVRCLFWARDVREGAGERQTFRNLLKHLEKVHPSTLEKLLKHIPEFGRWDDLLIFERDYIRDQAFGLIKEALTQSNQLAAKWMPRKGKIAVELREFLKMTPKQYRKALVSLTNVVEQKMCSKQWNDINFNHIPSIAASRYQKAFTKNAPEHYSEYRESLIKNDGSAKINAGAIYPHMVIQGMNAGDVDVSIAQWDALPNYLSDNKILPMVDVSGSMTSKVSPNSNISCLDVSVGLGLYLADKQTGAFRNSILTFSSKPTLQVLRGNIYEKYKQLLRAEWQMSTNIVAAFERILEVAKKHKVSEDEMPKFLLILSDMEFDSATASWGGNKTMNAGAFNVAKQNFESAGYKMPSVVFWNLNARKGNVPVRYNEEGVCLVSGFSTNILKNILAAKSLTPVDLMMDTLYCSRYNVVC